MTSPESSEDRITQALGRLAASGNRITRPRRHIVTVLVEAGGHLSADEIASRVQVVDDSIHLATVYRTLETLERSGVVVHMHLGHGRAIYHLADSSHYHLYCEVCGSVQEIPQAELDALVATIANTHNFAPSLGHFAIIGTCGRCIERSGLNRRSSGTTSPESIT